MGADISPIQTEVRHSRIYAMGACRGSRTVTNDQLVAECALDSSDEWIQQRTGIISRTFAADDQSLVDMAVAAGEEALVKSGIDREKIGVLILASSTTQVKMPATAPLVAHLLGLQAAAYDSADACSGYTHAIAQADALVRAGTVDYALVIGADLMSDIIDPHDRATAIIFADGAGAAVVGVSDHPGISATTWGSDGGKWDLINMTVTQREHIAGRGRIPAPALCQNGSAVFRWACWEVSKLARATLAGAGVAVEDIAAFVPHQANVRIIDELVKQIGFAPDTVIARDLITTGNTSGGSIPLAMHRTLDEHPELSGKLALQIGFGAGLAWAGQVVRLP